MKYICLFAVLVVVSGCATSSSMSSAERRFYKGHPGAEIVAKNTANHVTEHRGYWPHSTTRRYADYTFRYRETDGVEHEETWHYLNGAWSVEKVQPR